MTQEVNLATWELLMMEPWRLPGLTSRCKTRLEELANRTYVPGADSIGSCLPVPRRVIHLLHWSEAALLTIPGFGRLTLQNLKSVLSANGCKLASSWTYFQNQGANG